MSIAKWKNQSGKATSCMIQSSWHSGTGKIVGTIEMSVIDRGWRGVRDEKTEHGKCLGQWKYSAWYNGGYSATTYLFKSNNV